MESRTELRGRLMRFAVVGGIVFVVNVGLNALCDRWMDAWAAFLISYPPALALHFCLNKWWTFGCRRTDTVRQVTEYLVMVGLTFLVQLGVFAVVHGWMGVRGWLAAGVVIAAQMGLTFFFMQVRIFGRSSPA